MSYLCNAIKHGDVLLNKTYQIKMGKYQSGQMGRTVNPLSYDFEGSNPSFPTIFYHAGVAQLVERQPSKL